MCRFYGLGLTETMNLTIRQFVGLLNEMNVILRMELGTSATAQQTSLTGKRAHEVAMKMFGGKRK